MQTAPYTHSLMRGILGGNVLQSLIGVWDFPATKKDTQKHDPLTRHCMWPSMAIMAKPWMSMRMMMMRALK